MKTIAANLFWLLVALTSASAAAEQESLSQQAKSDFEWFSHLGFPDVKDCPFIRVARPQNQYVKAFLLTNNSSQFTYLSLDLFKRTLTQSTNGTPEHQRIGFDRLDLKNEAVALLDAYANGEIAKVTTPGLDERISKRITMFVFAWGCWRNGFNSEAEQLYQLSKTLRYGIAEVDVEHFQLTLEQEISNAVMWRAVIDFGNTSINRLELLREFQTIVTNYPHSGQQQRARQTVAMLESMIAEDATHAKIAPTKLDQLPVEDRVRELIFRLRDQHGEQGGQPDWCDIFYNYQRTTNTPAHQLVDIGYPAVPQLIAALEDQTFTRSVGYWRDFTFSHNVLTVGDCANTILGRITCKYFYIPTYSSGYMSKDNKMAEAHKLAEEWWSEFQKKGEKQMLIEGVASGVGSAHVQAEMLGKRFPEALVPALIQGSRVSTKAWTTRHFIALIETNHSAEARTFMTNILHEGSALCRATAALTLVHKDRPGTIAAMIQEWARYTNPAPPFDFESSLPIAHFLAAMDSAEAIAALKNNLQMRPASIKNTVINEVAGCTSDSDFCLINHIRERPAAESVLVEEFLITALQDEGPLEIRPRDYYWKTYPGLRICDEAGYYLNQLWPKRYAFKLPDSLENRDRQIAACRAIWKQTHSEK